MVGFLALDCEGEVYLPGEYKSGTTRVSEVLEFLMWEKTWAVDLCNVEERRLSGHTALNYEKKLLENEGNKSWECDK